MQYSGKTLETLHIDLTSDDKPTLHRIDFDRTASVTLSLPLPSFGVTNSYLDLCSDLLDASWALEKLALQAESIEIEVSSEYYKPKITAVLKGTKKGLADAIGDCVLVFAETDSTSDEKRINLDNIRESIADFEDNLPNYPAKVPEIVDWYFVNFMAALDELKCEFPEYWHETVNKFPEYGLNFFKSAYSPRLGGECYTSPDGWILPINIEVDVFFTQTGQEYSLSDFQVAKAFSYGNQHFLASQDALAHISTKNLLQSRVCAGILRHRADADAGPFEWVNDVFPDLAMGGSDFRFRHNLGIDPASEADGEYLVHPDGTLAIVRDTDCRHLIYGTTPLTHNEMKWLCKRMSIVTAEISSTAFGPASINFDWASLSDEDFEQLCYDILYDSPRFDSATIRKLGKSKSRDGGRDIEVYEMARWPGDHFKKKWIIQCKLVKGTASLGASKVTDVGDMLERYGAHGFGVFTSTVIDATLYDKLDDICKKREVMQMHKSVYEIERELARNPRLRERYFLCK